VENVKRLVKPGGGHLIKDRKTEIVLGLILFFAGCLFLYDAFDARNKKMIWPLSGLAPW